jgi:hypothetical protein
MPVLSRLAAPQQACSIWHRAEIFQLRCELHQKFCF